jgi:hypothetical protein
VGKRVLTSYQAVIALSGLPLVLDTLQVNLVKPKGKSYEPEVAPIIGVGPEPNSRKIGRVIPIAHRASLEYTTAYSVAWPTTICGVLLS